MTTKTRRPKFTTPFTFNPALSLWVSEPMSFLSDAQALRDHLQEQVDIHLMLDYAHYDNGQAVYSRGYVLLADADPREHVIRPLRQYRCKKCGMVIQRRTTHASNKLARAQAQRSYLCEQCRRQHSYSHNDFEHRYQHETSEVRFGFELEMCYGEGYHADGTVEEYVALQDRLINAGFARCSDGTVDDEFKSPIYRLDYLPGNLGKLLGLASKFTVDKNVGTHVHVSVQSPTKMSMLCNAAPYIFKPLEEYLALHEEQTTQVWGRWFGPYREFPMHHGHGSWLSIRGETLEWRLCKLHDYQQFRRLIKWLVRMCRDVADRLHSAAPVRNTALYQQLGEEIIASYKAMFVEGKEDCYSFREAFTASDIDHHIEPLNHAWQSTLDFEDDEYDDDDDGDYGPDDDNDEEW